MYAIGAAGLGLVIQLLARGEPLYHMIANVLFFTPFSNYSPRFYQNPENVLPEEKKREKIPEIHASDYSYAYMEKLTGGFKEPVIIKGLFSDTNATKNWMKPGYLNNILGDMQVGVYKNLSRRRSLTGIDKEITMISAGTAAEEIITNKNTQMRFIFPQLAHAETNGTDPGKSAEIVKEVMDDLEIERIRPGFGSKSHANLIGQQFFMGRRRETSGQGYRGVNWHSEPGNNWFVQVVGKKRWFLMSPKHSALMLPKKSTARLIVTSDIERIEKIEHRMPVIYGDLEEGDLLFNPEWWWHRTEVYPGVSISVPMREFYLFRTFFGNPMYSTVLLSNICYEMKIATFILPFLKKWAGFA